MWIVSVYVSLFLLKFTYYAKISSAWQELDMDMEKLSYMVI